MDNKAVIIPYNWIKEMDQIEDSDERWNLLKVIALSETERDDLYTNTLRESEAATNILAELYGDEFQRPLVMTSEVYEMMCQRPKDGKKGLNRYIRDYEQIFEGLADEIIRQIENVTKTQTEEQ